MRFHDDTFKSYNTNKEQPSAATEIKVQVIHTDR
jgi:hypothetical protein